MVKEVTSRKFCEQFLGEPPTEQTQAIEARRRIKAIAISLKRNFDPQHVVGLQNLAVTTTEEPWLSRISPRKADEFILDKDASDHGLGAALSQKDETGKEQVIAHFKNPSPHYRAPSRPIESGYTNGIADVDVMGSLPETRHGKRYILVMVDYFTKWAELVLLSAINAPSVTKAISSSWICNWGTPEQLHSERGTDFESPTMHELCELIRIGEKRTTSFHPKGNGLVERSDRKLKEIMKALANEVRQCDETLPQCLMAYRSTVCSSTNQTPIFMWTSQKLRLP
ncbi:uncharacterized protein DEA37_0010614 [Paragonimus westermani]|uniref:Integrase catalytic domain-containing protein n=1 Tax=Paragonimus westermani TaxID=34504 RepID=A0A5J4NW09_9TREM|nr:uncharacterized protein DEA37_0010614 [Paragonimus westermani]